MLIDVWWRSSVPMYMYTYKCICIVGEYNVNRSCDDDSVKQKCMYVHVMPCFTRNLGDPISKPSNDAMQ